MTIHNLPYQSTPFVGRVHELGEIGSLLADPSCRLLTLVGPGGIGKTRLAIEAVARVTGFTDGIYFVPLQPINVLDNIPSALATALDFKFQGKREPIPQILHFLSDKHLLLVLDNFEHLLEGAELVMTILHNAPQVKLLITTREALNLREEWVRSLRGLDYPYDERTQALETYSAVELFVRRVRQVRGDFVLAAEQEAVLHICRMVEGMPLALELAAARTRTLPCAVIADEIHTGIAFLAVNLRDVAERHRSMRAVFDWSWQLLTEAEQTAFMKLSVFQGGFTQKAAQAMAGVTLSALSALVEKSLIGMDVSGRYQFHDLLHRYASDKLVAMPELHRRVSDDHCAYFADFLAAHESSLHGSQRKPSLREIEGEIANIRAAWNWAVDHRRIEVLEQMRNPLYFFYSMLDWNREATNLFETAAATLRSNLVDGRIATLLGHLLLDSAKFAYELAKFESATRSLDESLKIFRQAGDTRSMAVALQRLATGEYSQGYFKQAYRHAQEGIALARQVGDDRLIEESLYASIPMTDVLGNYQEARQLYEHLREIFQRRGEPVKLGFILLSLGTVMHITGEYAHARRKLEESLAIFEELSDQSDTALALELLGQVAYGVGDFDAAQRYLDRSRRLAEEIPSSRRVGFCLLHGGLLACTLGDYATARESLQEVLDMAAAEGEKWKQARAIAGLGRVAYFQGNLAAAEAYLNDSLSRSREMGYRMGEAQILNMLGRLATAKGNFREAEQVFGQALKIGLDIETPPVILETFVGIADLWTHEGDERYASALCAWCLQHPALHADTRAQARQLLDKIPSRASPSEALLIWQSADLATIASEVRMQLNSEQGRASPAAHDTLTERELEVLRLLATRRTNREIAEALYISVGTVKTHVHRICSKLHVTSRHQAAPRAVELRLI